MTHASVFSGIGGPEVAAAMLGWENLFHCEINPFGRKVLEYWFPKSKSYEDITKTDFTEWRGRVNVLTGGFPCQPFSYAGQRRGAEDDRYLWPHMHRCINEVQPDWVVCENVAGILTMVEQGEVSPMESQASMFDEGDILRRYRLTETFTLERISRDIEADGYEVQSVLVPACAVGAPHRRDRVFIVGHRKGRVTTDTEHLRLQHDMERGSQAGMFGAESERGQNGISEQIQYAAPNGKRRPASDTFSRGEGAPRKSNSIEGSRSRPHQQPSEWGTATEWDNRLHAILRPSTNHDSHRGPEVDEHMESELANGAEPFGNGRERDATDTRDRRGSMGGITEGCRQYDSDGSAKYSCRRWIEMSNNPPRTTEDERGGSCEAERTSDGYEVGRRWAEFPTVSPVHRGNDGLPFPLDDLAISPGKWRTESLKAYGNAIVPQVMYEIFLAILRTEQSMKEL